MTPLAHKLAKQLVIPPKDRQWFWRANGDSLRRMMTDVHCFEASAVLNMVGELQTQVRKLSEGAADKFFGQRCFLPAPKTWLEFYVQEVRQRMALLLTDTDDGWARVDVFMDGEETAAGHLGKISLVDGTYNCIGEQIAVPNEFLVALPDGRAWWKFLGLCHYLLVIINTPRIIGRRQHMPHRGLERKLTKKMGRGKFPLHAWTEIKLEVAKPTEIDDGEPHEAHLTGRRALHFCRAHLRIRNGKMEYVTSHWRGDPAIGIKQSRYKLVA